MKTYYVKDNESESVYVGSADEIRPIYNAIFRAWNRGATDICPSHCERAVFHTEKMYGLHIDENGWMYVLSANTVLRMILDDVISGS